MAAKRKARTHFEQIPLTEVVEALQREMAASGAWDPLAPKPEVSVPTTAPASPARDTPPPDVDKSTT